MVSNPDVFADKDSDSLLVIGTVLHLPNLRKSAPNSVGKEMVLRLAADSTAQMDAKPGKPPASRKIAKAKKSGAEDGVRLKLTTGDLNVFANRKITEGEREILREKQRILMDLDDMVAYNLSLNHRLKQMEERVQELQAKLERMERQRSKMAASRLASSDVGAAPSPEPVHTAWEWSAYTSIIALSAVGAGLLVAIYLGRKRKRAEDEALMNLDLNLGKVWDAGPGAKEQGSSASSSDAANADVRMEPVVVPADAPGINRPPSSPGAAEERGDVSGTSLEITLGSIESAIEEADVYLALGEKDRAIASLKFQIDSNPRSTADLWLKLLEIYHDFDMLPEFELLAAKFRRCFNIVRPTLEAMAFVGNSSRSIEEFPLLMDKISSTWGTPFCLEYLYHLLLDKRDGHRAGFELGVVSHIILLIYVLKEELGKFGNPPADETPSEEIRAPEFIFEPSAPIEPEKSDLAMPELELDRIPVVASVGFPALSPISPVSAQIAKTVSAPVAEAISVLERRYPRIAEKITLMWGTPEILSYLKSLVVDNRGGRVGFDGEVASELMMLSSVASADEFITDIWSLSEENKMAAKKAKAST